MRDAMHSAGRLKLTGCTESGMKQMQKNKTTKEVKKKQQQQLVVEKCSARETGRETEIRWKCSEMCKAA